MATALILAAGKATRLVGLRDRYAKANVPVGGTTPLRFLLEALGDSFEDVWINLHFKGEQVREEARRWATPGVRLHFLEEPELLGTGGTLLEMVRRCGSVPELLVNAKMFTDFDFACMAEAVPGTLVLHPSSDLHAFGGLLFDKDHRLTGLLPRGSTYGADERAAVFTGICRPHPKWVDHLQEARARSEEEVLCLIRHGILARPEAGSCQGVVVLHPGAWCEISTPERVALATAFLPG